MTTRFKPSRFILTAAILLGLLAACAPPGWERPAPPTPSEIDLAEMAQATQEALENNKDGVGTNWSVEGSSHLGTATPTRTFQNESAAPCRDFQQTLTIDGRTQAAYGTACRDAQGNWNKTRYTGLREVGPGGPKATYRYPYYGYPGHFYPRPYYGIGPRLHYGIGFGYGHGHRFGHHRHRYHRGHHRRRHPDK